MPLKRGYSRATFEENYRRLRQENKPHEQALAVAYQSVRDEYFKHFPEGACPAWMVRSGESRLNPKRKKNPCACRKPNPVPPSKHVQARDAADLYKRFTGHDALDEVHIDKPSIPDVMLVVGDIDGVMYTTVRDGVVEKYIHQFKKKSRPLFCVSPDGKQIHLIGGEYNFTERGIVDGT